MVRQMKFYLAYGSNLSVEQMRYRCPDAKHIGTAEIKDYRLLFKGSKTGSYLTIEPMEGRKVPVLVWEVSDEDEASLDIYEGYPVFYQKHEMEVDVKSLTGSEPIGKVNAFVYAMDPERPLGQPTLSYYRVCSNGYDRFGFDQKILEKAYDESWGEIVKRRFDISRMKLYTGGSN
ncbi:MAG: gamma-glutamylcyclotransferase [Parasporobacterium sp.]|nr:gamma-glutamylcyclotransferase [Parasporobacterium sp.]